MRSCETCAHWQPAGAHALKGLCQAKHTVVFTVGLDGKEARARRFTATNPADWCERWVSERRAS